ncbi:hypothetical protein EU527_10680 [Candidatus Thorarchaeota archaeon]|nr:MAG: hypothetical protein EU527_10680 [Candidatus Thorarchaeota archaeon]
MRLPVCNFDLESDMLCTNCQARLDRGEITRFDIEFSKWLLEKERQHPNLESFQLLRAATAVNRLILVVKKNSKELLLADDTLVEEIKSKFGELIVIEGPAKLRRVVREFIQPAIEVGVNSLYSPDGTKENIIMLRGEDRERITYTTDELRRIVSAIMGESVLFEYQDDRKKTNLGEEPDEFDKRMMEMSGRGL